MRNPHETRHLGMAAAFVLAWLMTARTFAAQPMEPPSAVIPTQIEAQIGGFSPEMRSTVLALTSKTSFKGPFDATMLTTLITAMGGMEANDPDDQALLKSTRDFADGKISDADFVHGLPNLLAGFTGRAVIRLTPKAQAGDAQAMNELGDIDGMGIGKQPDLADAMRWYKKAAEAGNAQAMCNVAMLSELGALSQPDFPTAAHWLQKAADAGSAPAMVRLGVYYQRGIGVDRNPAQAMALYQKAADAGDVSAFNVLGSLCMAAQAAGAANAAGNATDGGGAPDYTAQALGWFRKGAAAHDAASMRSLGQCCQTGMGMPKSGAIAATWYQKAAAAGSLDAMMDLAVLYTTGDGVPTDLKAAMRWYEKAADLGNVRALAQVGYNYLTGTGVEQDYALALSCLHRAAEAGNPDAMNNMGAIYDFGMGVGQDYAEARRWYLPPSPPATRTPRWPSRGCTNWATGLTLMILWLFNGC